LVGCAQRVGLSEVDMVRIGGCRIGNDDVHYCV
jgi:hypothetical protein